MNTIDLIAGASATISLIAIGISYYSFRKMLHASSRPVLVFSMSANRQWRLDNVGTGPTIDLSVGEHDLSENFISITKCYPLSAGTYIDLPWIKPAYCATAVYTDIHGNAYTTICNGSHNEVFNRNKFPGWKVTHNQWLQVLAEQARNESSIREEDLEGKTASELDLMRNQIYARKGYIFRRRDLDNHFRRQDWYTPVSADHKKIYSELSTGEKYEAHLILNYQNNKGLRTRGTIRPLIS